MPRSGVDPAVLAREARIVELRSAGWSNQAVAAELGIATQTASGIYTRALRRYPAEAVAQHRKQELATLDVLMAKAWEVLETDHYLVQFGKLARSDDGSLLLDDGPKLAAIRELRMLAESRRKLMGTDAPSRSRVEVITEDVVEAAMRREKDAIVALEAASGTADRRGLAGQFAPAEGATGQTS